MLARKSRYVISVIFSLAVTCVFVFRSTLKDTNHTSDRSKFYGQLSSWTNLVSGKQRDGPFNGSYEPRMRTTRISKIYDTQSMLSDMYELEIKHIDDRPRSKEDSWLPVDDLDGHIYSAYLDARPEVIEQYAHEGNEPLWALIRVIAILPTETDEKSVQCVYKYPAKSYAGIYKRQPAASVKAIADNWSLKYSAFFVICGLAVPEALNIDEFSHVDPLPASVAIGRLNTRTFSFIDIHYPTFGLTQLSEPYNFMAVCVPVLHHSFNRPLDLVEFVEYYLQLGVVHFTFYNSSTTPEVSRVLEYYKKRGIGTVLEWHLPSQYVYEVTLRHEGLFASINDCLYRSTFHESHEYIGIFGTDDFLVPRKHGTLIELVEYLDPYREGKDGRFASYVFRNVFFYTMYENDRFNEDPKVPYLYTQAKTWALKVPNDAGDRSRYVTRGRDVVEVGNFRVAELRPGSLTHPNPFEEIVVEPEVAVSHQYAPCDAEETGCYLKPIVLDRTAQKFTKKLGIKVAAACSDIFGDAGCPFFKKQTLA